MINSHPLLYTYINPATQLVRCNNSFLKTIAAKSPQDLLGKSLKEIFSTWQTQELYKGIENCISSSQPTIGIKTADKEGQKYIEWTLYAEKKESLIKGIHLFGKSLLHTPNTLFQTLPTEYALIESMSEAAIVLDKDFIIKAWNQEAENIHQLKKIQVIGKRFNHVSTYQPLDGSIRDILRSLIKSGGWRGIVKYSHTENSIILELSVTCLKDEYQRISGYLIIIKNVNGNQDNATSQFYNNQKIFEMIVEHAPLEAWVTGENGNVLYMNPSYLKSANCTSADIGKNIFEIFPKDMAVACFNSTINAITQDKTVETIEKGYRKDGSPGVYRIFKFPIQFSNKRMAGGWSIDITDQVKLQEQLVNQEKAKKRDLVQSIITTQERERRQLSVELHDNVNQILSSCKLMLEVAQESSNNSLQLIKKSYQSLQTAITEIRKISHELNPSAIEDIGIIDAINEAVEKVNLSGKVEIQFHHNGYSLQDRLKTDDKIAIYRIFQEQLNNILKHANATHVTIQLSIKPAAVHLKISDNGVGFDYRNYKKGLGLKNISHRVEYYHGTMKLKTAKNKGCSLDITLHFDTE